MLATTHPRVPAMDATAIDTVRALGAALGRLPQVELRTAHVLHAGLYARTIKVPAGVALAGAHVTRATLLIVSGDCECYTGEGTLRLTGYHVLPASAGRAGAFYAHADTHITMLFPTEADSVAEAEAQLTDEPERLLSRRRPDLNDILITGEHA